MLCVVLGRTEDTATNIFLVQGGAREPQSGFPDSVVLGWCGGTFKGGLGGGKGSTAFVEQILAVVDVLVIFSVKFQQSKSYMFLKEPPSSSTELDLPVVQRKRHSANCAEDRRDPTGAVLGQG